MPVTMQAEAVRLATLGLHVFPLKERSKAPATVNGHHDATCDPSKAAAMFRPPWDGSARGIGIACEPSGLVVIDLDGPAGVAQRYRFPVTLAAVTGHGLHLYYRGAARSGVRNLGPGVDTRGTGGYVVAPPSVHPSGHTYRWEDWSVGIAPLPAWVAAKLAPHAPKPRKRRPADPGTASFLLRHALERFRAGAVQGGRNNELNRAVWYTSSLAPHAFLAAFWYAEAEAVGLGHEESVRTIASGLGVQPGQVAQWL